MYITSIGIDLGKTVFHLVALGKRSQVVVRRKFSRSQLPAYTANLPSALIDIEACGGSHFLGTALREFIWGEREWMGGGERNGFSTSISH